MVTDFHSHILPEIDDGSACVEESIALLRAEADQGIRHVIATPHFYARYDDPDSFLRRRKEAEILLRREMEYHGDLPEMTVGAEVHFFSGMSQSDALPGLTIGGKKCILIEMPGSQWTDSMCRELAYISQRRALIPIIAHVDRYISPFRTHRIPERLQQLPVLVQANASFFLNRNTRRMALKMLQKDQIHLLGSDCHDLEDRPPELAEALEIIRHHLGDGVLERIRSYGDEILERI